MMKQMRENTKWIMLVTALAFVALMVFEWGMDASGRSGMGVGQVGSVNGDPVHYDEWMATYRNLYDQAQQQQETPVSSQQNTELEDRAWDETVNQILVRQQLQRRGIAVTSREIQEAARSSPPPELRQSPVFQDDEGRFDMQRYQEFLARSADDQLLFQLEQYYRDVIPRSKLMRQVTSGIYPSDADLWERYRDRNEQVRVRIASLDPNQRIDDSLVSVTDAEVERHYEENRDDFRVPAQADVRIAVLPKAPTAADSAAALERAREIRREIVEEGADFAEVAARESADEGSAQQGGDLGTFTRGDLIAPIEEAAFGADEGDVTEPVQSPFGYHIVHVREKTDDEVTASHIVLPIERTDDSELQLLIHADSLEAMAETMPLEDAATNLGVGVRTVTLSEDFPVVAGAGRVSEAMTWAREEASPGDASPVYENEQSFYGVELLEVRPEGYQPLSEVRDEIRGELLLRKKLDLLLERTAEITEAARAAGSLEAVAEEHALDLRAPDPLTRGSSLPGIGDVPEVIGTAFGLSEGEISDPVSAENRAHLVELLERIPADSTEWLAQKEQQRQQVTAQLQQQRLEQWLAGLREQAEVRDRRAEVLQAAEDQEDQPMGPPMGF